MRPLDKSGNQGLGSWPGRRARMSGSSVALRQGDQTLTYAELADRCAVIAALLRDRGVSQGDRVAFLGSNSIATFEVFFASGLLGAIFVPLNTRLTPVELGYMLRDVGAEMLVVGHDVSPTAVALESEPTPVKQVLTLAEIEGLDAQVLDAALSTHKGLVDVVDVALDDPALILFSSGTTSRPKAAVLTHANLTWNTINQLAHFDLTSREQALCIAPLFHAVGLGQVTLPTLFKGGTVEVIAKFDAGHVLHLIEEHHVTSFSCVPTMLQMMAEHPDWDDTDLTSLTHVIYGGSAVNERIARTWLERGIELLQGYGMTEAGPGIYMALPGSAAERPVSVGVPHFFTDVSTVDADGALRPVSAHPVSSELVVRGPNVFAGYWDRAEDSEASLVDGKWFRTGDVVRSDDDDWGYVVDRVKDMIISGGENIYPAEVEAVMLTLDGVRSAALVAMPDDRWGEVGAAFVERAPGAVLTEADLLAHLGANLARFKIPKVVHFVDDLPRNATGKVKRVDLRELAREDVTEQTKHHDKESS